jgi:hypothetical protein
MRIDNSYEVAKMEREKLVVDSTKVYFWFILHWVFLFPFLFGFQF